MTNPTPLPTVDATASSVNKTVQSVVGDAVPLAEAALIAAQPWLGWPIICQLWEAAFGAIINALGTALGVMGSYVVMDVQKYIDLTNAANALVALNAAKASGDSNAIEQASQAADAAAQPIIQYIGSA